jgi:hypothetical protein
MENEWRMDANLRAYFPSVSANRWLAVRLEFIGSLIILAAAVFAIISVTAGSGLSAGMVGLAVRLSPRLPLSVSDPWPAYLPRMLCVAWMQDREPCRVPHLGSTDHGRPRPPKPR